MILLTKLKAWTNEEKHKLFPTQREPNAFAGERRGNAGKLEEFLDQTSIYEANFIFMSYSRLLSFSNFQTQYSLCTFHLEKKSVPMQAYLDIWGN